MFIFGTKVGAYSSGAPYPVGVGFDINRKYLTWSEVMGNGKHSILLQYGINFSHKKGATTLSITTLSIKGSYVTLNISDSQHALH